MRSYTRPFAIIVLLANFVIAQESTTEPDPELSPAKEAELISSARQITFEGRRAGEGYFSGDGSKMVFPK